jgi:2'-5' RNA ligase
MRCFVAVPLPDALAGRVGAVQRRLGRGWDRVDVRWSDPAAAHVTLKFLGRVEPAGLAALQAMLAAEASEHRATRVSLGTVGAFPSPRRARVVWLGLGDGGDALAQIAAGIDRGAAALGFAPEARLYTPHLTLGRVRAPRAGANLAGTLDVAVRGSWTVDAIVLYESRLRPAGAVHVPLAAWPLA